MYVSAQIRITQIVAHQENLGVTPLCYMSDCSLQGPVWEVGKLAYLRQTQRLVCIKLP